MSVERIAAVVDRGVMEQRLVGAVVLLARDGHLVCQIAAGDADREARRPMRLKTIFRLASLTKPIVSAVAMALMEQGCVHMDDVVSRWLPEFRPRGPDGSEAAITVRQLMTHTSGLGYRLQQPAGGPYETAGVSDGLAEPGMSMEEELQRLATVPLSFAPGTTWQYSLGLDVMGEILARAGGSSLPALVERFVTGPLGMADTAFSVGDQQRLAAAYIDGKPPRRMRDDWDIVAFGEGVGITFSPARIFDRRSFASGGAGMAGTATDFLTFLEALRLGGAPILKPVSVRAMMSNQIGNLRVPFEPTPAWGFGLGGAVLVDPSQAAVPQGAGTWKWGGVYGHHWFVDPERRLTLVALTNTAVEGMAGAFVAEILNAVYDKPERLTSAVDQGP